MTDDEKFAAIDWLETAAKPEAGVPEAAHVLAMVNAAESRENTVLGMCLAQRPHAEIRDFLMAEAP